MKSTTSINLDEPSIFIATCIDRSSIFEERFTELPPDIDDKNPAYQADVPPVPEPFAQSSAPTMGCVSEPNPTSIAKR